MKLKSYWLYSLLVISFLLSLGMPIVHAQSGDLLDSQDAIEEDTVGGDSSGTNTGDEEIFEDEGNSINNLLPNIILENEGEIQNTDTQEDTSGSEGAIVIEKKELPTSVVLPEQRISEIKPLVLEPVIAIEEKEIVLEEILDEVEDENIKEYSLPELMYTDHTPKANSFGFLYPETVKSVVDNGEDQIRCSLLTKENLRRLTGLSTRGGFRYSADVISKGNAVDLVLQGKSKLTKLGSNQITSIESIIKDIVGSGEKGTLVDVYLYRPSYEGALKGHRALAFVGIDNKVYILDPILYYKSSQAHHISSYISKAGPGSERYIDPTPYRISSSFVNIENDGSNTKNDDDLGIDDELQCVTSMYQEILYGEDNEIIDSTRIFQDLYLNGHLKLITENENFTEIQIRKDVVIDIPGYPLISIYKGTRITARKMSLWEFMDIQVMWYDDQKLLVWVNTGDRILEFDTPVEIIMTGVDSNDHKMSHQSLQFSKNTLVSEGSFVSHPVSGCSDDSLRFTYMPMNFAEKDVGLLYVCNTIDIKSSPTLES